MFCASHLKLRFSCKLDINENAKKNKLSAMAFVSVFIVFEVPSIVDLSASTEYVKGRRYAMTCNGCGMLATGMKTPQRKIIGNLK